MDFSFSFMQGIMGNTIQQPPQLIDSANIRQEDVYEAISDPGDDGGQQNFDSPLESGFSYPAEDVPVITNGYPTGVGTYEQQAKFALYSQFPNGSANGYGAIRNYGDHSLLLGEGTVLRPPVVQEKPQTHISPPSHSHHHQQPHHPHHHHHQQQQHHPHNPPLLPHHHHHPPPASHLMPQVLPPPPPLLLPSSPPLLSPQESTISNPIGQPVNTIIYIDKEPGADAETAAAPAPAPDSAPTAPTDTVTSPKATAKNRPERKQRRSRGSAGAKEEPIPRRQQPRRQCSMNSVGETSSPNQGEDAMEQEQPCSPPKPAPRPKEPSPPPVRTPWRTAAARKLLPLSITMKKLNVEIIKCDWQLPKQKVELPKKTESEERPSSRVKSPEGSSNKAEAETCSSEEERAASPSGWSDQEHTSAEQSTERKQQRRSVRSRSESEKSVEPVPKKKVKKEQVEHPKKIFNLETQMSQ